VLISDIGLPDGDGWELMERLGSGGQAPRFAIAMSGFGVNADEAKSRAVGYRHHLIKPFDPDKLEEILNEAALERR
jgi:CheY-like chemotaxis protein